MRQVFLLNIVADFCFCHTLHNESQVLTGSSGGASILSAHLDAESAMRQQQSLAEKCRVYKTLAASLPVANEDRNSLEALFDKLRMRLLPHTANLGSYSVHY